jgi:branched-chain amino acid transport system substrate-binding protein
MKRGFLGLACAASLALHQALTLTASAAPRLMPPAPLKIGVGAPISGSDSVFGTELRNGVAQAVQDINARGGILGRPLTIEIGDDAGDPKQGVAVANKFLADQVSFIIGHFNSGVTLAASSIYAEHNMLDITPASSNPQITERGFATIFRTCGRDDQQAAVAAKFLNSLGKKKIAILHDKTTYGKGLADETRKELAGLGIKDVFYDGVSKDEKAYAALAARLQGAGPDIVYWGGGADMAAAIIKAMRAQAINAPLLASTAIAGDEFASVGGDAVVGTLMTFPLDPRHRPAAAKVVQEFTARNIDPEAYTLYAYAAVEILKQAAEAVHSLDPQAIAKFIHSGARFSTVLGELSYDAKGDVTTPDYSIFIWKKGQDGTLGYDPLKP